MTTTTYASAHPRLTLWVGVLWAGAILLLFVSIALFAGFFLVSDPPQPGEAFASPPRAPYWVLWGSALMMLSAVLLSLPQPRGYEGDAEFSALPLLVRWPVKLGSWIGSAVMLMTNIFLIFSTAGGGTTVPGNARLAMSITSVIGFGAAAIMGLGAPGSAVLSALWILSIAILLVRGVLGMARLLPAKWLKPAWAPAER